MGKVINLDLILLGKESGLSELMAKVGELGTSLMQAGALIDQIGEKVRDFEKDSVETYKNYETNMLEAKGALSAQYTSATELEKVMDGLEASAQKWASSTIFHTDDVSKAISEAAHAGWSYEQMLEGIPNAMLLAQAGNIDLSTGLDYLIKTLNGTDTAFEDSRQLVDQWAMAANSSATNIAELGEALLRMGSTTRFADNNAELLAMLGALADAGTVGASAGTLLRNGMIRLIAPTEKASAAMSILGATTEEIEDALSNDSVTKAAKKLDAIGFSAYKDTEELKPFLEIFHDLNDATKQLSDEARLEVLSAIFPTRTITGALAIIDALDEVDALYEKILNSDGYAQQVADIQMSGLMGKQETFLSKWEEFSRKVGETLADPLEDVYEWAGGVVDELNGIDETGMSALVGGLTTIAGLGPGLMIVGGALKLFSTLGPLGTTAVLAAVGIGALVGYLKKANEIEFESKFGTLNADLEALSSYVDGLGSKFDEQQKAISQWSVAVTEAQSNYETALTAFSENLLIDTLTQKKLTPADIAKLKSLGDDIIKATFGAAENGEARENTFLDETLGDMESPEQTKAFQDATAWVDLYYRTLEKRIEDAQKRLDALIDSSAGKNITEDLRQQYQAILDEINQMQAEIANAQNDAAYETMLHRATRVSWDSAEAFLEENAERLEAAKSELEETYDQEFEHVRTAYNLAHSRGDKFQYTDSAGKLRTVDATEEAWQNYVAEHDKAYQNALDSLDEQFGGVAAGLMDSLLSDSAVGNAWKVLKASNENGTPFDEDGNLKDGYDLTGYNAGEIADAALELSQMWDKVYDLMEPYSGNKQVSEFLDYLGQALTLYNYAGNQSAAESAEAEMDALLKTAEENAAKNEEKRKEKETKNQQAYIEKLQEIVDQLQKEQAENDEYIDQLQQQRLKDAGLSGMPKTASERRKLNEAPVSDELSDALDKREMLAGELKEAMGELDEAQKKLAEMQGMAENEIQLTITSNADDVKADIDAIANGEYTADVNVNYIDPGFQPAGGTVTFDVQYVGGGAPTGQSSSKKSGGGLFSAMKSLMYESGGRTDEPAIFGEGDTAEWAIPEEHSTRTAQLLDATRKASGFTWPELLARTGGLNADTGGVHVTIGSYAPVIHAENANGVEKALLEDKKRLAAVVREAVNGALEERSMREAVEVYV